MMDRRAKGRGREWTPETDTAGGHTGERCSAQQKERWLHRSSHAQQQQQPGGPSPIASPDSPRLHPCVREAHPDPLLFHACRANHDPGVPAKSPGGRAVAHAAV